ncbi:uncharacterized protein [Branchiostoma lanceolatum]|uniref:uncharacterized protein n=1 Tax=Branchiostoma lanceolatum TaxID=7740 RepID=UPI00345115FE
MVNMGSLSSVNMEKAERIHLRVRLELGRGIMELNKFTSQLLHAEQRQGIHTAIVGTLEDMEMLQHLVQAGIINYWEGTWLTAIQTIGDGNCLLHAVSLYMWGVQDKKLNLRRYLDRAMQDDRGALRKRWAHQRRARDATVPGVPIGGVNYEPGQWDGEWNTMVQMASAAQNESEPNQTRYRPLEEFHIFVLANILRRPIVVSADTSVRDAEGNSWAPIPFGGIYLPLLHAPAECVRSPVLLAYNNQHFTPLLTTQTLPQNGVSPSAHQPPQTIPLMRQNGERLPVQYILPEEEGRDVLAEYLNIIPAEDSSNNTLLAGLDIIPLPDHLNLFKDFIERDWQGTPQQRNGCHDLSSFQKPVSIVRPLAKATLISESMPVPCTEDMDGLQASHSPLDESFLRMKLQQGEQTATVVSPGQMGLALPDCAQPFPLQENVAPISNTNGDNFGRSQEQGAGGEGQLSNGPASPPVIHSTPRSRNQNPNTRNQNVSNNESVSADVGTYHDQTRHQKDGRRRMSAEAKPSYAAAVKRNPGPSSTPSYQPTCKTEDCKVSPSRQNGGYCMKCQRQNSAEERKRKKRMRERELSLQGNNRPDTPVKIGRAVNKKRGGQPTKPKPQRPQSTHETQRSATLAPYQSDSPETTPMRVVRASSNAIQTCTAPGCEGVVDESVHGALCPECFSHLERRNSQTANGGGADSCRSPNTSMTAPSPAQPAADMHFAQEPKVRTCLTKACKRNALRENGYYCSVHAPNGSPQQRQQEPHSIPNNTSQQFCSYSQPPSISSIAPISLTFNGPVEHLHVHHHYPSQNVSHSNETGGLEVPQNVLRAGGSVSVPRQSHSSSPNRHNEVEPPVSDNGPVCPKCGRPGNAWFNGLCQKCQQQLQGQ